VKPTYFDFTVQNLDEARRFFESVLGWRFEKFPMPYEYYRITAGSPDEPGIDGGVGEIKDAPHSKGQPLTQVTITVPNLDECLVRAKEAGGNILEPKIAIPGIGWYATCTEPGGLIFGVIQADPDAN
jgi:predicted enzyme related to lactoylglutathione lyase